MNCKDILQNKYDYIDGYLDSEASASIRSHLDNCQSCREDFQLEEDLLKDLRDIPVPAPSSGFAKRAFENARMINRKRNKKSLVSQWGAAIAASIILCIIVGLPVYKNMQPDTMKTPGLVVKANQQKTVKLVINTPRDLMNAKVLIQLPQHVEMVGFPGLSEISWNADLHKGKNLLRLPIVAKTPGEAQLVTRIDHQNKSKLLKFDMKVYTDPITGNLENKKQYIVLNKYYHIRQRNC